MQKRNYSDSSILPPEACAEKAVAQLFGVPAAFTHRASLAIKVVLQDRFRGQTVALSPIVCQDVISAVLSAGCSPLFVDLDPKTTEVPASEWVRARNGGATVAIAVHLFGLGRALADVRGVFTGDDCLVIDDAAQAVGTKVGKRYAGTLGDVGILSFGHSKQLPMGGAAVLTRDHRVLDVIRHSWRDVAATSGNSWSADEFRSRLNFARRQVAQRGREASGTFEGLLEGYETSLTEAAEATAPHGVAQSLPQLDKFREDRMRKLSLWRRLLADTQAVFFEYPKGTNPWRAVFRLPGIDWGDQEKVADEIRNAGVPLSTWYLPGHWFLDGGKTALKGAEQLSREVFQLWIDETTTDQQIRDWAPIVEEVLQSFALVRDK